MEKRKAHHDLAEAMALVRRKRIGVNQFVAALHMTTCDTAAEGLSAADTPTPLPVDSPPRRGPAGHPP
jgi:hypothetical protein